MLKNNPDLFAKKSETSLRRPLAERMRPGKLDEIIGHEALVGKKSVLYRQLQELFLPSLILWGPPGVGKTTLARVLAQEIGYHFVAISAVSSGVKEVREIIETASQQLHYYDKGTILFIDEIHRFNKAQQDALLHSVEEGTIVLIGATTENPGFEVINPLLSRCQVLKMDFLTKNDLTHIIERALNKDVLLKQYDISIEDRDALIFYGAGDARRTLNLLEMAFYLAKKQGKKVTIATDLLKQALDQNPLLYDKKGDYHYDIISAFIKSVRGSDPDAAVYWLARMLDGGEDPLFIARRLIILASEDIGNAEPYALSLANAGFEAVNNIGLPEAQIILAQVTTYLASAPKSNAAYLAIQRAAEEVKKSGALPVPLHLRNAPLKLMQELKYGAGYKYPHDFPDHFVAQNYLPEKIKKRILYEPVESGREVQLRANLKRFWAHRREK